MSNPDNIKNIRQQIDKIDSEILKLINQRAEHSIEIGKIKKQNNLPIYNPQRELELLANLCNKNQGPLSDSAIKKVFQIIIKSNREIQL